MDRERSAKAMRSDALVIDLAESNHLPIVGIKAARVVLKYFHVSVLRCSGGIARPVYRIRSHAAQRIKKTGALGPGYRVAVSRVYVARRNAASSIR
jgi:hypothetical protein